MRHELIIGAICGLLCCGKSFGQAMVVSGAPLTASYTRKIERAAGIEITTIEVARSSDGSVYRAGTRDGKLQWIEIDDVPNDREIWWSGVSKGCKVSVPREGRGFVMRTAAQQGAIEAHWQGVYAKGFDRQGDGEVKHVTALGTRTQDGMVAYGHHYTHVRNRDGSVVSEGEAWTADIGLTISENAHQVDPQMKMSLALTNLKRAEPDAMLFVPPVECSGVTPME